MTRGWTGAALMLATGGITCLLMARASPATPVSAPSPPAAPEAGPHRGAELYALHCASCHGAAGEGTGDGIQLRGVGAAALDFALSTGRMPLADPHQAMVRRSPVWPRRDIDDVVAFVSSLGPGGPAIPAVHPDGGDLSLGQQVFNANCAPCHGTAGQGAAVGEGADAPDLQQATALEVAEAVRVGPDPMPRFDERVVDQHGLDSLVRYVLFLRSPPDPGGFNLGHAGPVVEGFVAWIVGFAALAIVIRLIGTTV